MSDVGPGPRFGSHIVESSWVNPATSPNARTGELTLSVSEFQTATKLAEAYKNLDGREKFFKFQTINSPNLEALTGNCIWLSARNELNDPFDCQFKIRPFTWWQRWHPAARRLAGTPIEFNWLDIDGSMRRKELSSSVRLTQDQIPVLFEMSLQQDLSIYCVSSTPNEQLMWSYYADGHSGMCLFLVTPDELLNGKAEYSFEGVDYVNKYPTVTALDMVRNRRATQKKLICSKNDKWRHEKEWRLISWHNRGLVVSPFKIAGVAFGIKATAHQKAQVVRALSGQGDVVFYQCYRNENDFSTRFWNLPADIVWRFEGLDTGKFMRDFFRQVPVAMVENKS